MITGLDVSTASLLDNYSNAGGDEETAAPKTCSQYVTPIATGNAISLSLQDGTSLTITPYDKKSFDELKFCFVTDKPTAGAGKIGSLLFRNFTDTVSGNSYFYQLDGEDTRGAGTMTLMIAKALKVIRDAQAAAQQAAANSAAQQAAADAKANAIRNGTNDGAIQGKSDVDDKKPRNPILKADSEANASDYNSAYKAAYNTAYDNEMLFLKGDAQQAENAGAKAGEAQGKIDADNHSKKSPILKVGTDDKTVAYNNGYKTAYSIAYGKEAPIVKANDEAAAKAKADADAAAKAAADLAQVSNMKKQADSKKKMYLIGGVVLLALVGGVVGWKRGWFGGK